MKTGRVRQLAGAVAIQFGGNSLKHSTPLRAHIEHYHGHQGDNRDRSNGSGLELTPTDED
jgi:hypothetical protein